MFKTFFDRLKTLLTYRRLVFIRQDVGRLAKTASDRPVVFFNASARLSHLSQNAAFSLLTSYGLRLTGLKVVHFVCNQGMSRCVLGTDPDDVSQPPPCAGCVAQSRRLFGQADVNWFDYNSSNSLRDEISDLNLDALKEFEYHGIRLGDMVLPSIRWTLRCHHLEDTEEVRYLYREYILSAYNVSREFSVFMDKIQPRAVIVFNGIMFPEAIARHVANERGIRVITHEVGMRPLSAFFTDGQATAYPLEIPTDFDLNAQREKKLDNYLEKRFSGQFTMAGVRFWPQMQEIDTRLAKKAEQFKRFVPVFTNVIFDTSQVHANSLFTDMFAWLDEVVSLIRKNPTTLFVIRAHPDEMRPGTRKQSRESVKQWITDKRLDQFPNLAFIDSGEYVSSYELIKRAHFVMIYNSSIGLEASILGKPVLAAGASRFTRFKTVYVPNSAGEYVQLAQQFLSAVQIEQPSGFTREARRVLYFQLFKTALPFDEFLSPHNRVGYVHLKRFKTAELRPENSPAMRAIYRGIVEQVPFLT